VGYARGHSLAGLGWGLLTGFFLALGFAVAAGAALAARLWPARAPQRRKPHTPLDRALAPILDELETVRLAARRRVNARAAWMTPVGVAAGLALWLAYLQTDPDWDPAILFAEFAFWGGFLGYLVAARRLVAEYERLYKARILPQLTALFGALTYRRPPRPDVEQLRGLLMFPSFGHAYAEDAIGGAYRGLEIDITQLRLSRGAARGGAIVFRGLLCTVRLKNPLQGFTAVTADEGWFGALAAELSGRSVRRVALEDPEFERVYQVYSTDQVMARALLTPDFMIRLLALANHGGFGRPVAVAQASLLLLALPRSAGLDFFQAPAFDKPAYDADALAGMKHDIEAILRAADSVIDLDDATRSGAADSLIGRDRP